MNIIQYKEEERLLTLDEKAFNQLTLRIQAKKKIDEYHFNMAYSKLGYVIMILLMLLHAAAGIAIIVIAIGKAT